MTNSEKPSQHTLEVLSESQVYRDYERAFAQGTGLPISRSSRWRRLEQKGRRS